MKAKSIKKMFALLPLSTALIGFTFSSNAQAMSKMNKPDKKAKMEQTTKMNNMKQGKPETKEMMKDHVCTQACHKAGKHVYTHGEKGHVCTAQCKKSDKSMKNMKTKACTTECKDHKMKK